VPLFI